MSTLRQRLPWPQARRRVIVGDQATVGELRRRWLTSGLVNAGDDAFARFVSRQGVLALERAERGLIGSRYKLPTLVREEVGRSKSFWAAVAELSRTLGQPPATLAEEALRYLEEMMTRQSRLGVDLFGQLERVLLRSYRIEFDGGPLQRLRELNKSVSLVFLPSHRSYMDPLVLGHVLREQGFPPNHVLGGVNLDFWPVGPLARRAGIVFIRRTFRDNEVYKFALRQYLTFLVDKRFNLEWYLEGGRSRTGKLRPPRFGIFGYLVEAYRQSKAKDVLLVPVSIVYDQLYEVGDMTQESQGARKPAENVGLLVRYMRAQGRRFGAIHVRIGEPLSLREALESVGDERLAVEKVAIAVAHGINRITPITPTSLVTLALLGFGDRALTLAEIHGILAPLLAYVRAGKLPLTEPELLRREEGILSTLEELRVHGVVTRFGDGLEPVYAIGADQHLVAAYYRNGAVHFFVNRALAELAAAGRTKDAVAEALRLRDLFKFEFFFPPHAEHAQELKREPAALPRTRLHLAHRVLASFLEAYLVVAERLAARAADKPVDEKAFIAECVAAGRQYLLQRRIHGADSVSGDLYATALKLAANRDLLEPGASDLAERRRAFAEEIGDAVERLDGIRQLAIRELDRVAAARRKAGS